MLCGPVMAPSAPPPPPPRPSYSQLKCVSKDTFCCDILVLIARIVGGGCRVVRPRSRMQHNLTLSRIKNWSNHHNTNNSAGLGWTWTLWEQKWMMKFINSGECQIGDLSFCSKTNNCFLDSSSSNWLRKAILCFISLKLKDGNHETQGCHQNIFRF